MQVEADANLMTDQAPDPRWRWVITAAQLQHMTFPEDRPSRRERQREAA